MDMSIGSVLQALKVLAGYAQGQVPALEELQASVPSVDSWQDVDDGQVVLVRADLDAAVSDGKVKDPSRIQASLPTVRWLLEQGCRVVLLGHIGRAGKSLQPVSDALSEELGKSVQLILNPIDEDASLIRSSTVQQISSGRPGDVFLFENLRHYKFEQAMWKVATEADLEALAPSLVELGRSFEQLSGLYVNEAIAASNMDFSTVALPLCMKRTSMGLFLRDEIKHLVAARQAGAVIMSGVKADKLTDLERIIQRGEVRVIVVAGALAMSLIKASAQLDGTEFSIGRAETEPDAPYYVSLERLNQAKQIVMDARQRDVRLSLPVDFVLDNGQLSDKIPEDRIQLDIGPESSSRFAAVLGSYVDSETRPVIFYNGVPGMFEDPRFSQGTSRLVQLLVQLQRRGAKVYVGGGEGRQALTQYSNLGSVEHAFTAGGTVLKAMSDRPLPPLGALYLQNRSSSD
jgi:phosphoglycerate kinase